MAPDSAWSCWEIRWCQHPLRGLGCSGENEHLPVVVADPWPFNMFCAGSHGLLVTVAWETGGRSGLPSPPGVHGERVGFCPCLDPADRLFQCYAVNFWSILWKDCLVCLPTSSRILTHLKPRRCDLAKFCLRRGLGCLAGLEAEPFPLQWSRSKEP